MVSTLKQALPRTYSWRWGLHGRIYTDRYYTYTQLKVGSTVKDLHWQVLHLHKSKDGVHTETGVTTYIHLKWDLHWHGYYTYTKLKTGARLYTEGSALKRALPCTQSWRCPHWNRHYHVYKAENMIYTQVSTLKQVLQVHKAEDVHTQTGITTYTKLRRCPHWNGLYTIERWKNNWKWYNTQHSHWTDIACMKTKTMSTLKRQHCTLLMYNLKIEKRRVVMCVYPVSARVHVCVCVCVRARARALLFTLCVRVHACVCALHCSHQKRTKHWTEQAVYRKGEKHFRTSCRCTSYFPSTIAAHGHQWLQIDVSWTLSNTNQINVKYECWVLQN